MEKSYAFRFASSNRRLHLTQQQIDGIPYLSALIAHEHDFLCIQNGNGEYVLNEPLEYSSFVAILNSMNSQDPSRLLEQLSEEANVFDTIQLRDYLGLPSFSPPLLKGVDLKRSKPDTNKHENQRIEYHRATIFEALQTAGEFLVSVVKNEYKLGDAKTIDGIFTLINLILFNAGVFNFRFRAHTLAIAKRRCYSLITKNQRRQLERSHRLPQYEPSYSEKFRNIFYWRGAWVPKEDERTMNLADLAEWMGPRFTFSWLNNTHRADPPLSIGSTPRHIFLPSTHHEFGFASVFRRILLSSADDLPPVTRTVDVQQTREEIKADAQSIRHERELLIRELKRNLKQEEAQSARTGRFNTSSSHTQVDKFKHRCGPKAQKHR